MEPRSNGVSLQQGGEASVPAPTAGRDYVECLEHVESAPPGGASLDDTIEAEIIPRLMLLHRSDPLRSAGSGDTRQPPTDDEVHALAAMASGRDLGAALRFVAALREEGVSREAVLLSLVAPCARLLAEGWHAQTRSDDEWRNGLDTLGQLVAALGTDPAQPPRGPGRPVLALVPDAAPAGADGHPAGLPPGKMPDGAPVGSGEPPRPPVRRAGLHANFGRCRS